jgi:hypothetical protein
MRIFRQLKSSFRQKNSFGKKVCFISKYLDQKKNVTKDENETKDVWFQIAEMEKGIVLSAFCFGLSAVNDTS